MDGGLLRRSAADQIRSVHDFRESNGPQSAALRRQARLSDGRPGRQRHLAADCRLHEEATGDAGGDGGGGRRGRGLCLVRSVISAGIYGFFK